MYVWIFLSPSFFSWSLFLFFFFVFSLPFQTFLPPPPPNPSPPTLPIPFSVVVLILPLFCVPISVVPLPLCVSSSHSLSLSHTFSFSQILSIPSACLLYLLPFLLSASHYHHRRRLPCFEQFKRTLPYVAVLGPGFARNLMPQHSLIGGGN